ncbi:MAG TPA: N-acetyl sugar amidotransferase [Puia sp.]|nr:N-acetyl sugar amidotransferase [Puia sp.]
MEPKKRNEARKYVQCVQCVMDTNDDPYISFNAAGVCNHCENYRYEAANFVFSGEEGQRRFDSYIRQMKADGKNKPYDCIIGISGGVDSTYLALVAKENGLRALGVHCDNGWNSELAVNNIESIVRTLDMDLYTYVIDWEEFRDIQLSYFKANVIDIEAITDLAFRAVLEKTSVKYDQKYFLSGDNVVTESVLPKAWICKDYQNLINIHKKFGKLPIRTFPILSHWKSAIKRNNRTVNVTLLNLIDYKKDVVKQRIVSELGWRDYGGKHFESVFTRFYQGYILPRKFGVDKRKAHLSNLICSGQMTKEEAIEELKKPIYDQKMYAVDREFVLKKLGMTNEEFEAYIQAPQVAHEVYGLTQSMYVKYPVLKIARPIVNLLK